MPAPSADSDDETAEQRNDADAGNNCALLISVAVDSRP